MELRTTRLHLRHLSIADAKQVFVYRSLPEIYQHVSLEPNTIIDVENFIASSSEVPDVKNTWYQLGLCKKDEPQIIGDIGLHFLEEDQVEIGYTLSPIYHKKGYATEALLAVIEYLFQTLNKTRITASVDPSNLPSIQLLEKLGFEKKAHNIKSLWFKGQWVDDVIYELTRSKIS